MNDATKSCPFCGEQILAVARKCKHCQSDLEKKKGPLLSKSLSLSGYETALLIVPTFGVIAAFSIVFLSDLSSDNTGAFAALTLAVIIGIAIAVFKDASHLGMKTDKNKGEYSPVVWVILILLFWFVSFPAYMGMRKRNGGKNLLLPSIILVIAYFSTPMILQARIDMLDYEERLAEDACGLLTEILQEQLQSSNSCVAVDIENEISPDTYRANALIDDGSRKFIKVEDQGNYLYVEILN